MFGLAFCERVAGFFPGLVFCERVHAADEKRLHGASACATLESCCKALFTY